MSTESPGLSSSMTAETLDFLLECSVCLEPLTSSHKVLPCQHTFCIQCLQDLYAKKKAAADLLCPECRTPCPTPLQNLPCNVILNRILEVGSGQSVKKNSEKLQQQQQRPNSTVAGNPATNPFLAPATPPGAPPLSKSFMNLNLLSGGSVSAEEASPISPPPTLPPKPSLLQPAPAAPPPPPPPTPSTAGVFVTPAAASSNLVSGSGAATPPTSGGATPTHSTSKGAPPPAPGSTSVGHQIYRALYDYSPAKSDELSLRKGELYIVIEKCKDGWYKGSSVASLKTGVFPGNYVQHIKQEEEEKRRRRREESSKTIDEIIDLDGFGMKVKGSTILTPPPNVTLPQQQPAPQRPPALPSSSAPRPPLPPPEVTPAATARERYRCTVSYPASSEYELDLRQGDILVLLRRRDDGWCKGRLERTGQTGLFPASFVQKI